MTNMRLRKVLAGIVVALYMPFYIVGVLTFYASKILKAIGYLLMRQWHSAVDEFRDFFAIDISIHDIKI